MKNFILILLTLMSLASFSQEYLGKSFDDIFTKITYNAYIQDYKIQDFSDSTIVFTYYDGFIKSYIFSKEKKVIGELFITSNNQIYIYLCQFYDAKCFKDDETSWFYKQNHKIVETGYSLTDIDGKNYHIFHSYINNHKTKE